MLGASVALPTPASAHGDKEEREQMRFAGLAQVDGTPVLSDNVEHLGNIPGRSASRAASCRPTSSS